MACCRSGVPGRGLQAGVSLSIFGVLTGRALYRSTGDKDLRVHKRLSTFFKEALTAWVWFGGDLAF